MTDLTIDCLRSLNEEIWRVPGTKVAVCENGTGGDAAERLRRAIDENGWDSWVDLMTVYPNRGFTGGTNAVIRPALQSDDPPEYVLLLNSDTIVDGARPGRARLVHGHHPRAGVAGSMLVAPDGTVESSPFRFPGIATELDRGLRLGFISRLLSPWSAVLPKQDGPCRAGWVSGASLILRRTMLEQIGLLDEGLYTYFDDPDICLRAARAGWETWYVPESRVVHLGGATTGLTGDGPPNAPPGLLAPSTAPVLLEELRGMVHGAGRRGVHSRVCNLAPQALAPAQAGHGPSAPADRLDPP